MFSNKLNKGKKRALPFFHTTPFTRLENNAASPDSALVNVIKTDTTVDAPYSGSPSVGSESSPAPGAPDGSLNSFMSKLSLLDFKRESPWIMRGAPSSPMYDAQFILEFQLVMQPLPKQWENIVPKQFSITEGYSIPEIYLNMIRSFSYDDVHTEYCSRTPEGFRGCFDGTKDEIDKIERRLNSEFGAYAQLCFDTQTRSLVTRPITRAYLENTVFPQFLASSEPLCGLVRESTLTLQALRGDVKPLVIYFMANSMSKQDIWIRIMALLVKHWKTPDDLVRARELAEDYLDNDFDLAEQLQAYVERLVLLNLFTKFVPKSATSTNKATTQTPRQLPAPSPASHIGKHANNGKGVGKPKKQNNWKENKNAKLTATKIKQEGNGKKTDANDSGHLPAMTSKDFPSGPGAMYAFDSAN